MDGTRNSEYEWEFLSQSLRRMPKNITNLSLDHRMIGGTINLVLGIKARGHDEYWLLSTTEKYILGAKATCES